jgi:hypothetical protein
MRTWNILSLVLAFVGTTLAFLDSYKMASRLPDEGFSIGYPPKYKTPFWRWCGPMGFGFLTLAFLIQLAIAIFSQDCSR